MKIKTSAPKLTPKNLSMSHYTTIGFGEVVPVCNYEVMPKSKFTIKPQVFARSAPMYLPNLGSLRMNMHGFYVPFHLVWKHFENFVVGRKSWTSAGAQIYRKCPFTNSYCLTELFVNSSDLAEKVSPDISDFGASFDDDPQSNSFYRFTLKGKRVYHILSALGYKFTFDPHAFNTDSQSSAFDNLVNEEFSLLPLMCYFKAFMDRYIPSYLQQSSPINQFFSYINELSSSQISQPISYDRIKYLFDYVLTYYEGNYFTYAWTNPNSPIDGVIADFQPVVSNFIDYQGQSAYNGNIDTPTSQTSVKGDTISIDRSGSDSSQLSSTQISLLQKFSNLIRKLNYSGTRTTEALKSLFGINASDLQVDMSVYLGSMTTELNKTDVTNTSSTGSEELGDMAGKSWFASDDNRQFKVDCDYYGMVFVFASIDTPSTFVRGLRRNLTHIKPLSFYNPELDGTLLQAIRGSELFSQNFYLNRQITDTIDARGLMYENSYGFVPRYSEYNIALDNISGDFDIGRLSSNISPYILPREVVDLEDIRSGFAGGLDDDVDFESAMFGLGRSNEVITPLDVINTNDSVQFNRIFRATDGSADPFYCVFYFDTLANTPSLPLDDVSELRGRGKELEFNQAGDYVN